MSEARFSRRFAVHIKAAMKRFGLALAVLGLIAGATGQANASLVAQSLGTSAPPGTLGSFTMTPFGTDPTADFTPQTSLTTPLGGTLTFGAPLEHSTVPVSWATWSHGYTGSVYYDAGTSLSMTLAPQTGAFYFYAEPNQFATFTFTATAQDGTTLTQSIDGFGGAQGFGFYGTGGTTIASISVTETDTLGFAIGEFGVAPAVTAVPEPSTLSLAGVGTLTSLAFAWRRRKRANA